MFEGGSSKVMNDAEAVCAALVIVQPFEPAIRRALDDLTATITNRLF
jgi:hypothetical protein